VADASVTLINQLRRNFMSTKTDNDNHSNQMNPNNDEYWNSRGEDERPDDWEDQASLPDNDHG